MFDLWIQLNPRDSKREQCSCRVSIIVKQIKQIRRHKIMFFTSFVQLLPSNGTCYRCLNTKTVFICKRLQSPEPCSAAH